MRQTVTAAYQCLIAAVIERAIDDLKGTGPRCGRKDTDRAMAFILSDICEAYCLELAIDYETIREKGAALYRKLITKEITPRKGRYVQCKGKLPGNRSFPVPKIETRIKNYSLSQGSPRSATSSRKSR